MGGMSQKAKFFRELLDRVRKRARARWVKVGGAIGLIFLAVQLFLEEQVVSAAQWVWPRLQELTRQEVGVVGLAGIVVFFGVAIAVVVLAYVDARPPRPKASKPAPPLTETDNRLIRDIRSSGMSMAGGQLANCSRC